MKRFFLAVTVAVLTLEAAAQPSREPVPNVVATARPAVTIQYGGPTRAEGRSYNFTPTFFIFPAEKLDPSGAARLLEELGIQPLLDAHYGRALVVNPTGPGNRLRRFRNTFQPASRPRQPQGRGLWRRCHVREPGHRPAGG